MFLLQKYLYKKELYWIKRYPIALFFVLLPVWSFSQEINLSERITSIAEELAANEEDPEAVSVFIDRLQELAENRKDKFRTGV